jgi:DNA topoisomerase-2
MWIYDKATKGMAQKQISYVPGFFKIFDEILVNAADNKVRTVITVLCDSADGELVYRSMMLPWTRSR